MTLLTLPIYTADEFPAKGESVLGWSDNGCAPKMVVYDAKADVWRHGFMAVTVTRWLRVEDLQGTEG